MSRRAYLVLAGLCDGLTGLLLLLAPDLVMRFMGVATDHEPVLLRYIGVFVALLGVTYLYPWWRGVLVPGSQAAHDGAAHGAVERTVVEVTAVVRGGVAAYVAVSILAGTLSSPWWLVALTDSSLAVFQVGWWRRSGAAVLVDGSEGALG